MVGHVARYVRNVQDIQKFDRNRRLPYLEEVGIAGRIILKWILRKLELVVVDWINVAQVRVQWWDFVNAVMNFVSKRSRIHLDRLPMKEFPVHTADMKTALISHFVCILFGFCNPWICG